MKPSLKTRGAIAALVFIVSFSFIIDFGLSKKLENLLLELPPDTTQQLILEADLCNALLDGIWGPTVFINKVKEKYLASARKISGDTQCYRYRRNTVQITTKKKAPEEASNKSF
jgi:hypothetical protein